MGIRKNNQAKKKFSFKNDEPDLIDICQFIRDTFPHTTVKREWFIFWDNLGRMKHTSQYVDYDNVYKYRHPDIMVFCEGKLVLCYEIDGSIHNEKIEETMQRNEEYKMARVPLLISNTEDLKFKKVDIYDDVYTKLNELIG